VHIAVILGSDSHTELPIAASSACSAEFPTAGGFVANLSSSRSRPPAVFLKGTKTVRLTPKPNVPGEILQSMHAGTGTPFI